MALVPDKNMAVVPPPRFIETQLRKAFVTQKMELGSTKNGVLPVVIRRLVQVWPLTFWSSMIPPPSASEENVNVKPTPGKGHSTGQGGSLISMSGSGMPL